MARRTQINYSFLRSEITKMMRGDRPLASIVYEEASKQYELVKEQTLQEFESHPVTQELQAGAYGDNQTGTISPAGNLYSLIGFDAGTDPTEPIRSIINSLGVMMSFEPKYAGKLKLRYSFPATQLNIKEIEDVTPMPSWTTGSWVRRVEKSIEGINHYLFYTENHKSKPFDKSRSGTGIQIKGNLNKTFKRIDYITGIIKNFNNRLIRLK
jgi:hypothetical protein